MKTKKAQWMGEGVTQIIPESHDEWLDARRHTIGGSEVASVMGINPYCTPLQLYQRKRAELNGNADEFKSIIMDIGHYLEPLAAEYWENATGMHVIRNTSGDWIAVNDKYPLAHVSPDRLYFINGVGGKRGIIECKSTRRRGFDISDFNDPTFQMYFCQLQWGMGIMGLEQGSLAVLKYGYTDEFVYQHFDFNKEFFDAMYSKVEEFMTKFVAKGCEPDAISVDDIRSKFKDIDNDSEVEATKDILSTYLDLVAVSEQIAVLEDQKDSLESSIKVYMADKSKLVSSGQTIATWRQSKPTVRFDTKRFQSERPDLYGCYSVESEGSRRFVIKK